MTCLRKNATFFLRLLHVKIEVTKTDCTIHVRQLQKSDQKKLTEELVKESELLTNKKFIDAHALYADGTFYSLFLCF